ncbi:MAG: hypothetical protein ACP5OZ_02720 [Candidatus Woesearchaeota archaeon]
MIELLKREIDEFGDLESRIKKDYEASGFIAVFEITNGHNGRGNSNLICKKQQLENNEYFITKKLRIERKNFYNAALFVATNPKTIEGFSKLLNSKKEKKVLFVKEYHPELLYKTIEKAKYDLTLDSNRKEFFSFLYSSAGKNDFEKTTEYFNKNNFVELESLIKKYEEKHGLWGSGKHLDKSLESYPGKSGFIRGALAENYSYEIFDYAFKENSIEEYSMFKRVKSTMLCRKNKNFSLSKEQTRIEIDLIIISEKKYFAKALDYLIERKLIFKKCG